MAENEFGSREPQQFAEYSLWNDSAYSMFSIQPINRIEFTRPVAGSIFLSPPGQEEDKSSDEVEEEPLPQPRTTNGPGFLRYMKRAMKVVTREDLQRDPAQFKRDPDSDDTESSEERARGQELCRRPPRPRWRTAQQVTGRGRRLNLMQRRLEQALSQPARIERGANMMRSMGWDGGALGRDGGGIVEPLAPDPYYVRMLNAANSTHHGLGLPRDSAGESSDSGAETFNKRSRPAAKGVQKSKKQVKQEFFVNILQYIREFVKNDLQIEMFFEPKLHPRERKRIHETVAHLMGAPTAEKFDASAVRHIIDDIGRRNAYVLGTISKGEAPQRQICVYKEARENMYLVTPDDVRHPPAEELEEETNPFLKSIAKHSKGDAHPAKEHTMLDRIINCFVEFSEQDVYTEFRFLGAYNVDELDIMSSFFGMITCLIDKHPYLDYPEPLVEAFEKGLDFTAIEDANGFVSIKKWFQIKDGQKNNNTEEKNKEDAKE